MASRPPTNPFRSARPPRGRGGFRGGRGGRGGNPPPSDESSGSRAPPPAAPPIVPKPASRRASRTIVPPPVNTQPAPADIPPAPNSARRRRSQGGKPNANLPPKTAPRQNVPPATAPLAAPVPVKDTPPHLNKGLDIRHDIDALVERVRAVAMDNRPSTPGSHIDWAGDDDDSLPDLDDWGVTTATSATFTSAETISPIIVEGLRPLPDITSSITASPLRQVITLVDDAPTTKVTPKGKKDISPPSKDKIPAPTVPPTTLSQSFKGAEPRSKATTEPVAKPNAQAKPPASGRQPWHPSLPQKPVAPSAAPSNLRNGAAPMRSPLPPKSPVVASKDPTPPKIVKSTPTVAPRTAPEIPQIVPLIVEPTPLEKTKAVEAPIEEAKSTGQPTPTPVDVTANDKSPSKIEEEIEGLAASMHAPNTLKDSASAPANMSSYSNLPATPRDHNSLTHTRAQTAGRLPPYPRSANPEHNPRFGRSPHWATRGGFQQGYHSRNHSSPPASASNGQRTHASRPIITGDAMSRLARTIGRTNGSPKPQPLTTLTD